MGNARVPQRGAHQRPVAPLVDVGAVLDHPPRRWRPCLAAAARGTSATHVRGGFLP